MINWDTGNGRPTYQHHHHQHRHRHPHHHDRRQHQHYHHHTHKHQPTPTPTSTANPDPPLGDQAMPEMVFESPPTLHFSRWSGSSAARYLRPFLANSAASPICHRRPTIPKVIHTRFAGRPDSAVDGNMNTHHLFIRYRGRCEHKHTLEIASHVCTLLHSTPFKKKTCAMVSSHVCHLHRHFFCSFFLFPYRPLNWVIVFSKDN